MLGGLFATVFFILPIILTPGVEPPAHLPFSNGLSMSVRISNHNPFTPLTDVEYSCEVWYVTLANGAEVKNANVFVRGTLQKFDGSKTIVAPCETAYVVKAPIKAAEYRLTLTYRAYPWRTYRRSVYHIAAHIDENGKVTGWELN
jgi:hypothetical protein